MFFNNFKELSNSLNCKNPVGQGKNPLKIHLEGTPMTRQNGGREGKNPKNPKNPPFHPEGVYTRMLPDKTADFKDFRDYTVITVFYIRILRRFLLDFINSYREIYFILNHYELKFIVPPLPEASSLLPHTLWPLIATRGRLSMAG